MRHEVRHNCWSADQSRQVYGRTGRAGRKASRFQRQDRESQAVDFFLRRVAAVDVARYIERSWLESPIAGHFAPSGRDVEGQDKTSDLGFPALQFFVRVRILE